MIIVRIFWRRPFQTLRAFPQTVNQNSNQHNQSSNRPPGSLFSPCLGTSSMPPPPQMMYTILGPESPAFMLDRPLERHHYAFRPALGSEWNFNTPSISSTLCPLRKAASGQPVRCENRSLRWRPKSHSAEATLVVRKSNFVALKITFGDSSSKKTRNERQPSCNF